MYKEYPTFKPEEIVVYVRKSRTDDPMLTIEEVLERQEKELNDWQERNLPTRIPADNFYKEIISGESLSARVEFRKLLKRLESPGIRACLVRDCSRLGRPDLEGLGRILNLFRYNSVMVITPRKIFNLNEDWDRKSFQNELMSSREYLDQSKVFLNFGKDRSRKEGWFINGVVPYGYEKVWVYEGKRERPTLAIIEDEAKVVRMIFDWYVNEEIGAMKISQRLNAMGIQARKGGLWKKSSVINILKNEHYLGKIVIRKHIDVNTVEDLEITKHCVFNPDYEVVDGKHPAIIDEDTFNKAQTRVRLRPSVKPNETLQNPFAGILKCECGRCMRRSKDRHKYRYLCDEQMFCGNASIQESELIPAIIENLTEQCRNLEAKVTGDDGNKKEKHKEYVSLLESKCVELEKKELSLWEKYTEEKMPKQIFDKLMEKCLEEKQNLEKELQNAYNNVPIHTDYKNAVATLHEAIESLPDDSVSASVKNKLLKSVVDKIVYKREKPTRMSDDEAKDKGVKTINGWYRPDFEMVIHLKF